MNHPLIDVTSKMPLLISRQKKYTNIPKPPEKAKQYFRSSRGIKKFFADGVSKGQPAHTHAAHNERKADRIMWPPVSLFLLVGCFTCR